MHLPPQPQADMLRNPQRQGMPVTFRAHIRSGHLDNIPTQLVEKSAAMHVGLPLIRMELAIIFNGDLQIDIRHIQIHEPAGVQVHHRVVHLRRSQTIAFQHQANTAFHRGIRILAHQTQRTSAGPQPPDLDRALPQPVEICFKAFDRGAFELRVAPHHAVGEHHKFRGAQHSRHHHPRAFRRCATHCILHYVCLNHPCPPHITDADKAMMLVRGGDHTFKTHLTAPTHARALNRQQRQRRHTAEHRWRMHLGLAIHAFLKHFVTYAPQFLALFRLIHISNPSTRHHSTPVPQNDCGYVQKQAPYPHLPTITTTAGRACRIPITAIVGWGFLGPAPPNATLRY